MSLSVAVVQGGPSAEAEVSRASAAAVSAALVEAGYRVIRLELGPFLGDTLRTSGFDVVFPVAHGAVGEDGSLQGLLEVMDLPYVGSGVLASAVAMNKRMAKVVFRAAALPVAAEVVLSRGKGSALEGARAALDELGPRVVVKPCSGGSAIGVARFAERASPEQLAAAIEAAWSVDEAALIERFILGREVTCGVLDLGAPAALPPTEILARHDAFYTYEARYAPGRSEHRCPAPLEPATTSRVQEVAVLAHSALGCRDLSRVDFVVPEPPTPPTLLEVNTMPGFTATSLYPEAAGVAGQPMAILCAKLVEQAHRRGPPRRNAPIPLPR